MASDRKKSPATTDAPVQTSAQLETVRSPRSSCRCGRLLVFVLSVIVISLAVVAAIIIKQYEIREMGEAMLRQHIGEEAYAMFQAYDRDADGYLSLAEFEPLLNKLDLTENQPVDFDQFMEAIDPTQEVLSVQAHFKPLLQETMTKDNDMFMKGANNLVGLNEWNNVYQAMVGFGTAQFATFLPEGAIPVGQVYELVKSNLNTFTSTLSSNRYHPPKAVGREVLLHALLSMFHRRPFLHTRFGPQGAIAVVRAESEAYVDVVFRIHAEFQLNEPPVNPFWFTPAQFTGNLIIKRDSSHIEHFHLYVPNNNSLNVDMEWMNGPLENENMEVDIGYMPLMELTAETPSSHIAVYGENGEILQEAKRPISDLQDNRIKWSNQITMEEAHQILELHFYPFKEVPYLPFTEAFQRAAAKEKLVHSILLWGALDDQSC